MIKKEYKLGKDGRDAIKKVAHQIGDILGKTLGPAGRNYFLPIGITNDGKTILEHVRFEDECEDNVALAFHEIARQTDKDVGDGTTTSVVVGAKLAEDLIEKVPDLDIPISGQKTVISLMEELENEKNKALEILKTKVATVNSLEMLEKVAFTSSENKESAKIIASTMWEAGKDAFPVLDNGVNEKIEKDVVDGVRYPLKPSRLANKTATYENCSVLVVNHAFEQYLELTPFMASMIQNKPKIGSLVIVAKQFSVPFTGAVANVSEQTKLPIILVSADLHQDTFEDIASYVDATCFDTHPKTGKNISQLNKWEYSGHAKKIVLTEKETTFIEGQGKEAIFDEGVTTRVEKRVAEIKSQLEVEKDEKERMQMERRIGALSGGIATIYVDAKTAGERTYLRLKTEDAMNSCKAALNDGIVQGGGATLKAVADELGEGSLLYGALTEPYKRMILNNGGQEFDTSEAFDAYAVAKASIENPVSIIKTLITIEGIIADKEHDVVDEFAKRVLT